MLNFDVVLSMTVGLLKSIAAALLQGAGPMLQAGLGGTGGSIDLPLVGRVGLTEVSLPALTVLLALVDSFNPCAFFVLLFLLTLLVHSRSRSRMALIGGTFIFFSGFIYFLFLAAWLKLFMLLGAVPVINAVAGVIAVIIAALNIKDYFLFKRGPSLTIPEGAKPGLFHRMRELLKSASAPSALAGTAVLAAAANSYELLCTAGFPMVFTRALTLHSLSPAGYYAYIGLYSLVYVLPLAAILAAFILTLGAHRLTERQGRRLKLVSGLMMLGLGLALLLDPLILTNAFSAVLILAAAILLSLIIMKLTGRLCEKQGVGIRG